MRNCIQWKKSYLNLVDLINAFDKVPREVLILNDVGIYFFLDSIL